MNKKIFVSFLLTAVLVFGVFAVAAPAQAEASTLWGVAQEQLGANASASSIYSLVKKWALQFSINIPEWGIVGTYNHTQLNSAFLKNITGTGTASAQADPATVTISSPTEGFTTSVPN